MKAKELTTRNNSSCTFIIRSAGERTVPVLRNILKEQVNSDQIFEVQEVPLAKALKECYKIGIKDDREWLLILDGDILPATHMISTLIETFTGLDKRVFGLQCRVLDKMAQMYRPAGIHMHRTALLQDALDLIPQQKKVMRPESVTIQRMDKRGNPTLFIDDVLALHDYEQYYQDLFRKGYFLAHKSTKTIPYLKKMWGERDDDPDYTVLLKGLKWGEQYDGLVTSNLDDFKQFDFPKVLNDLGLVEKQEIDLNGVNFSYIERIKKQFKIPSSYWNFTLFADNENYEVSTKRRFLQLKGKFGLVKLIPWSIGTFFEKVGKLIKNGVDK